MKILLKQLACLYLLINTVSASAVSSFNAEYAITKGLVTLGIMSRRLLIADDNSYIFESTMETKGLASIFLSGRVVETSSGRIAEAGFVPLRYRYDKQDKRKDYTLTFDYDGNVVRRDDPGEAWSITMPPATLDKLIYQAQLMIDVASNPSALEYTIADRGKLKQYAIANMGSEQIATPFGHFDTIKLERHEPGSKKQTTVWCARSLDWIPVKVEFRDKNGSLTTATLRALPNTDASLVP